MARQAGPLYFTGTIDDITFYKMDGVYLARKKSSLDRKRFRTDPRFARSRKSAADFGKASKLASEIYWQLPKEQRGKGVVNRLTGQVGQLLKEGKTIEEVKHALLARYQTAAALPTTTKATPLVNASVPALPLQPTPTPTKIETTPSTAKPSSQIKQARYLSKWKVSRNGRLQIPKTVTSVHQQCIKSEWLKE